MDMHHRPGPATCCSLRRPARDALFSVARLLERRLQAELAAANLRRLLDFCRRLQSAVGTDALGSPLASRLLGSAEQQAAAAEAQPDLDYSGAVALAASCLLAADGCGRGAALQLPWPYYLIGTRDSFAHHLVPVRWAGARRGAGPRLQPAASACEAALAPRRPGERACLQPCRCFDSSHHSAVVEAGGRRYMRTRYYLRAAEAPPNYPAAPGTAQQASSADAGDGNAGGTSGATASGQQQQQQQQCDSSMDEQALPPAAASAGDASCDAQAVPPGLLPIGVTAYTGLFSNAELAAIEAAAGKGATGRGCAAGMDVATAAACWCTGPPFARSRPCSVQTASMRRRTQACCQTSATTAPPRVAAA